MKSKKRLLWVIGIVAVVLIGLGIRSSLLKSKQHARLYDFPETGYQSTNQYVSITSEIAVITLRQQDSDEDEEGSGRLNIRIFIEHKNNAQPLRDAVLSAKLHDDLKTVLRIPSLYVIAHPTMTVNIGGEGHPGASFARSTPIDPAAGISDTEQLREVLYQPIRVKISHSQGTELIMVMPKIAFEGQIEPE